MIKVMTIVGTRPELIKMSRVIAELDNYTNHILVHTGQNYDYELNQVFFEDLDIRRPNYFLDAIEANVSQTIARILEKSDEVMEKERPDALLLYGDTNSCLAVIAAKRRKIPVFHMEAGNRCFDQRVPEELNRKVLDHLSDINLVLTEHARRYLIAEGIRPETIIKTGSHMREILTYHKEKILKSDILSRLHIDKSCYFVVSAHREENVDSKENLSELLDALNAVCFQYNMPVIVSTHPRTRNKIESLNYGKIDQRIKFLKPFGFCDYIKLQMESLCVISDSGSITEEASLLNLPAITIRNTHERPEGMDEGTLIMSGLKAERVLDAIKVVVMQRKVLKSEWPKINDYESEFVSKKILRIVLSYTEYVNSRVWFK